MSSSVEHGCTIGTRYKKHGDTNTQQETRDTKITKNRQEITQNNRKETIIGKDYQTYSEQIPKRQKQSKIDTKQVFSCSTVVVQ